MKPGDKVVCIDDSVCQHCGGQLTLIKNQIYVIINARVHPVYNNLGLKLIGYVTCSPSGYINAKRFRLLDELKQESKLRQSQTLNIPCSTVQPSQAETKLV